MDLKCNLSSINVGQINMFVANLSEQDYTSYLDARATIFHKNISGMGLIQNLENLFLTNTLKIVRAVY